jgi:hypothetical protein
MDISGQRISSRTQLIPKRIAMADNASRADNRLSNCKFGTPGDQYPARGDLEVLEITVALQVAGIPSCIVGTAALIHFGTGRVSDVRLSPLEHSYRF